MSNFEIKIDLLKHENALTQQRKMEVANIGGALPNDGTDLPF